ncbi:DUF4150 domain-containing protein [Agrobacterium larrymoorei]|uniref:PAAR-like domain-containing protein n=1 Tax=Agrobacterium larrymoorei TaxID=160699 RepID=UPI001571BD00|nr:PAAR-like domain-containing protein [Agrobacterium larrymoorei]NTJ44997.1 DUF4150 domain-containing protein [Agrobacterium larrymoorei]
MSIAKISARKCASNVIVSTTPDVCWTPVGSDVVKVGYSSIAFLDTAIRHSTTVRNNGKFDFQLNSRCSKSTGHEPGTKRGVVVPGYLGPAHVEVASHFVFSEGWATCSHRDPAWINRPDPGPVEPQKSQAPAPIILAANDGTPGNNRAQNAQVDAVCRILKLTKDQRQMLHREIGGQNYGFQEIMECAKDMFGK